MVVLAALEFTFGNSLLEELFWRVYLYRELGGGGHGSPHGLPLGDDPDGEGPCNLEAQPFANAGRGGGGGSGGGSGGGGPRGKLGDGTNLLDAVAGGEGGGDGRACFGLLSASEAPKVAISAYYASYHFVVMVCFVPWYLALPGFLGLVVLGRLFVWCRESERLGLLTGYGVHAGLDGAFCLIMTQLYFKVAR